MLRRYESTGDGRVILITPDSRETLFSWGNRDAEEVANELQHAYDAGRAHGAADAVQVHNGMLTIRLPLQDVIDVEIVKTARREGALGAVMGEGVGP